MFKVLMGLVLAASPACAFVDTLDGQIDDRDNCCAAITKDRIRECMAKFEEPGWCGVAVCHAPIGNVEACLTETGEILDSWD
jgi:hypothetical protein